MTNYLPIIAGLALFIVSGPSLFFLTALAWHIAKVGVRKFFNSMPTEDVIVVNKLMRVIQTMPGDSLATGVRRAWIVSVEHGPTCLIHHGVPLTVSQEKTPYEHEARWRETAKMYERREVCQGKQ
jgi:hypothetical protein